MVITRILLAITVIVFCIAKFIVIYCDVKNLSVKLFFLQIFWLWKNRKWTNCRAKRRALQKYLDEKR